MRGAEDTGSVRLAAKTLALGQINYRAVAPLPTTPVLPRPLPTTPELVAPLPTTPELVAPLPTTPELASSVARSEEHTSELQSLTNLVCRLLLEKKKQTNTANIQD